MLWMLLALNLARAEDDPTCPLDGDRLAGTEHLRAISIDLRGYPPSPEEYAQIGPDGEVPDALVDAWLDTPEFAAQVVRRHRALLWNNVTNQSLLAFQQSLSYTSPYYYKRNSTIAYRGKLDQTCGDFPATFGADGRPKVTYDAEGDPQEGWVEVAPYWAPDTIVKVCAFDAEDAEFSPSGVECATAEAYNDPGCGCGPDLRWCALSSNKDVLEAMGTDVDLRVTRVIEEDLSYLELLTGDTGFVNGPLAYFLRNQTSLPGAVRFTELPIDPAVLPDLPFTAEDTWVEIPLGEHHSGVFTSPAYLLRFATNRARANRFYNDFLCQPFVAPEGGIPDVDEEAATLDLSERAGCNYCHALLEPAAAYWGRWTPSGGGYIDPAIFPAWDEDCALCGETGSSCSDTCSRFYVTDVLSEEEAPFVGWLKAYEFLDAGLEGHVEEGPQTLVNGAVADGRLPRCVADRTASWLLGRQPGDADEAWIDDLATDFAASGFRYDQLVKAIVTSEPYRRVE